MIKSDSSNLESAPIRSNVPRIPRRVASLLFALTVACSGIGTHGVLSGEDAGDNEPDDAGGVCFPETEEQTCLRHGVCGVVDAPDNCGLVVRLVCECDAGLAADGGRDAGSPRCGGNGQACCSGTACNAGLICVGVVCLPSEVPDAGDGADGGADGGSTVDAGAPSDGGVSDWWLRAPANSPPARTGSSMAYDPVRGVSVLFGGDSGLLDSVIQGNIILNDTWEWNGTTWTRRMPDDSPLVRHQAAMTYDSRRGVTLLFGGLGPPPLVAAGPESYSDTWEWNGTIWTERTPSTHPGQVGALAYDSARGVAILFGGETWEWDGAGAGWTLKSTADTPPARTHAATAYDSARHVIVLFGGKSYRYDNQAWEYLNDTWEWNGRTWIRRRPATSPPARGWTGMAYDSARGGTVLFGGQRECSSPEPCLDTADTWEWDGTNWTQAFPLHSPSAREGHGMVYDAARGVVVLFGGSDESGVRGDTWEYGRGP